MYVSRRGVFIVLIVVLLGAGAVFGSVKLLKSEEVLYQRADDPGADPFTDPAVLLSDVQPVVPVVASPSPSPSRSPSPSPGASPGFTAVSPAPSPSSSPAAASFGKKGDCDPEKLIEYLNQVPERRAAWADVLKTSVGELDSYIRDLTPATLTRDARVTVFGFKSGNAYDTQAILATGTAVLVDANGDIVARCICGNPVTPPHKIKYTCKGCPSNYSPPPACNRTCYEAGSTTTTSGATTTTSPVASTTGAVTTAPKSTVTRKAVTTTKRAGTTTTALPVSQSSQSNTTYTFFPPSNTSFPAPATAPPSTTTTPGSATTTVPGGTVPSTTTTTTMGGCLPVVGCIN